MRKVTFVLKKPTAGKATPIELYFSCFDGRLKYYTGERATISEWPSKLSKGTRAQLKRIESHIEQMVVDYKIKGDPIIKEVLKESLDTLLKKRSRHHHGQTMFDQMTEIVDRMETGLLLTP